MAGKGRDHNGGIPRFKVCPRCKGDGKTSGSACPSCDGSGMIRGIAARYVEEELESESRKKLGATMLGALAGLAAMGTTANPLVGLGAFAAVYKVLKPKKKG